MPNTSPEANDQEIKVPENKVQALGAAYKLFSKLPLSTQLLLAAVGLLAAIYFGWRLGKTLFDDQENLKRTLAATIVSTAYPHRGVTAFLVAELDKELPTDSASNSQLKAAVDAIQSDIQQLTASAAKKPKRLEPTVRPGGRDAATTKPAVADQQSFDPAAVFEFLQLAVHDKPNVRPRDENSTWKKAVISKTMKEKGAYLMVPAITLRQAEVDDSVLKDDKLREVFQNNKEVLFDFYVASRIDDKLRALGDLKNQPLTVVQAYFISESGVILLRALPYDMSYDQTFPTNTLFMDRLYFWGAIDTDSFRQKKDTGPLDFQSAPYIDLGGNGVVKTYSERVDLPNHRSGVVCVDVQLPDALNQIKERLTDMGAQVKESYYTSGTDHLQASGGEDYLRDFQWVNTQIRNQALSRITGAVAFQSDFPDAPQDGVVRFTIPIQSTVANDKTTVTKLLLVSFDFGSIKFRLVCYTIGFVAGILLPVFVLTNLLLRFDFLRREMNQVLEHMSKVMEEAATPFVWLNGENQFLKVNNSFLKMVGDLNDTELKARAPTFRDLITAETQPTYDAILEQSRRGEPTPKYRIDIIREDREVIKVWAHGERIPYPTLGKRRPAHRFGVFLPWPAADDDEHHEGETDIGAGVAPPKQALSNSS